MEYKSVMSATFTVLTGHNHILSCIRVSKYYYYKTDNNKWIEIHVES